LLLPAVKRGDRYRFRYSRRKPARIDASRCFDRTKFEVKDGRKVTVHNSEVWHRLRHCEREIDASVRLYRLRPLRVSTLPRWAAHHQCFRGLSVQGVEWQIEFVKLKLRLDSDGYRRGDEAPKRSQARRRL